MDTRRWTNAFSRLPVVDRREVLLALVARERELGELSYKDAVMPLAQAEGYGTMAAVHLESGNWEAAKSVVDLAQQAVQPAGKVDPLTMNLAELEEHGLSVRTVNTLEEFGYMLVADILPLTASTLMAIPNFGKLTVDEIDHALKGAGLHRREKDHWFLRSMS